MWRQFSYKNTTKLSIIKKFLSVLKNLCLLCSRLCHSSFNEIELLEARIIVFKTPLDGVNHLGGRTLPSDSGSSFLCHGNLWLSWGSTQQGSTLKQDGSRRGPLGLSCSTVHRITESQNHRITEW